uniref:J domain-containing protein n=1 Tax=Palpitomonas bilix TaxID=652834 RepID=A0A7S3GAA0_9EUKA|mmetsp:Transcript_32348/g.83905  ORF Transcript_32348/g.83905 Transcript_32348/m.83905 type:complete len:339 (+) Transcript_32348:227-1243(+)
MGKRKVKMVQSDDESASMSEGEEGQGVEEVGESEERCLYEVLQVERTATAVEIKKAYRRLALQLHPDKNKEEDAEEKFKSLQSAYAILSDEERRKLYDETGEVTEGLDLEKMKEWAEIWKQVFPPISASAIQDFMKEYKGSEEQKKDVLKHYAEFSGNMKKVMTWVMMAEVEDEPRFVSIIDAAVQAGDVKKYEKYAKWRDNVMGEAGKKRREKRRKEIERFEASHAKHEEEGDEEGGKVESARPIKRRKQKREKGEDLFALITQKRAQRKNAFDAMISKYSAGNEEEVMPDLTDEEFERARAKLDKAKEEEKGKKKKTRGAAKKSSKGIKKVQKKRK